MTTSNRVILDLYGEHFPGLDPSLTPLEHSRNFTSTASHVYQKHYAVPTQSRAHRSLKDKDHFGDYNLCQLLGLTRRQILTRIIYCEGSAYASQLLNILHANFLVADNGYWEWNRCWQYQFSVQWRNYIMTMIQDQETALVPMPEETLVIAAGLLGIEPDTLRNFVEQRANLELFMEQNRGMLSVLAESKLWELVNKGDPATVRWVLSRIKKDVYGDAPQGDSPKNIEIIEVEGPIH